MSINQHSAATYRFPEIRVGDAWEWSIGFALRDDETGVVSDLDLTGAQARFIMKRKAGDTASVISLTESSGVTVTPSSLSVALTSSQTSALVPAACDFPCQLQIKLVGGDWWTPIVGPVRVVPGAAHE